MAKTAFEIAVEAYVVEHGSIDMETMDTLRTVYMTELSGSTKVAAIKARQSQEDETYDKLIKKERNLNEIEKKSKKFTNAQKRELLKDEDEAWRRSFDKNDNTWKLALTNNMDKVSNLLKSFIDEHDKARRAYNVKAYADDGNIYKAWLSTAEKVTKLMNSLKDVADNF